MVPVEPIVVVVAVEVEVVVVLVVVLSVIVVEVVVVVVVVVIVLVEDDVVIKVVGDSDVEVGEAVFPIAEPTNRCMFMKETFHSHRD